MKNKKGFTLSEILVVLALISIILLIVIPSIFLITKRINRRLYEGKKEAILAAAELYGKDNSSSFNINGELIITVEKLLETGYIEIDVNPSENTETNCPGRDSINNSINQSGCIINPMDKTTNLNKINITINKKNNTFTAAWDETNSGQVLQTLMDLVCENLRKAGEKGLTKSNENEVCVCMMLMGFKLEAELKDKNGQKVTSCYFTDDDPKNWLYYSEMDFRIMGIEKVDGEDFVKMITNK